MKNKGDYKFMTIKILQTISNTLTLDGQLEQTHTSESYVIKPDEGKLLKNVLTGEITSCLVCVNKKAKLQNYVEVDDPKALTEELLEPLQ
jgi:hypothetical protein